MIDVDELGGAAAGPQRQYSTPEAAEICNCSAGHLQNLRKIGGGPPYQRRFKRKGIYYLDDDLQAWRQGRRYNSTSEY